MLTYHLLCCIGFLLLLGICNIGVQPIWMPIVYNYLANVTLIGWLLGSMVYQISTQASAAFLWLVLLPLGMLMLHLYVMQEEKRKEKLQYKETVQSVYELLKELPTPLPPTYQIQRIEPYVSNINDCMNGHIYIYLQIENKNKEIYTIELTKWYQTLNQHPKIYALIHLYINEQEVSFPTL